MPSHFVLLLFDAFCTWGFVGRSFELTVVGLVLAVFGALQFALESGESFAPRSKPVSPGARPD
jgi:hypothetical protein